ncbi:MAG: hypothetical protein JRN08_03345 [Nitrososphaerota archaeon]|nr:hypothetical protein [Nitrososphaerota archaeon]
MPRILFGVSPVGLGHATRALVLKRELESRGAEVLFFSGGKAADFIRENGSRVEGIIEDSGPTVVGTEMRWPSLWYIRSWWANKGNMKRAERLFASNPHELVVCDEEFSGVEVAEGRGERRVFISDELELGFARSWLSRRLERRVEGWYRGVQDRVDLLIVPEWGEDSGNRRFVGPIVRAPTMSTEGTRQKYGIPMGDMVLFSASGSGVGVGLAAGLAASLRSAGPRDLSLVITGNRGARIRGDGVYDLGVVKDNQDLVASADVVVSTAGKSTIDEASAAGTPIIAIPIRNHAEQERNAAALGYSNADSGRLLELVRTKLGKRGPPRPYSGEKKAADEILALLGASARPTTVR